MNPTEAISHVNEAIAKALRGESYIDPSVLDIKGFSTATQRHLVSNLAHLPGLVPHSTETGPWEPCYLEVGLYAGATFCAAISNNPNLVANGFEDFSQPFGDDTIEDQLLVNIAKHAKGHQQNVTDFHCNPFKLDHEHLLKLRFRYGLYNYDGEHSFESQAKALPHFIDAMADTFIFLVDDYAWEPVRDGTRQGLDELVSWDVIKIEQEWILSDGRPDGPLWHNDVGVWVISKEAK